MCGIFGQISKYKINKEKFNKLVKHSEQRGIDSSGLVYYENEKYKNLSAHGRCGIQHHLLSGQVSG
jgi:glucosamine 6-phosphate synthetase-like amidotransferase/phosphosugar isomerase protein